MLIYFNAFQARGCLSMSLAVATRNIVVELNKMLDKRVMVRLSDGRSYVGKLVAFDPSSLHVVIADAESSDGRKFQKVVVLGNAISEILLVQEELFDAHEFANYILQHLNLPPASVRVDPNINAVIVYDRIRVTERGVEGSGQLAQRIYELFENYMKTKRGSR